MSTMNGHQEAKEAQATEPLEATQSPDQRDQDSQSGSANGAKPQPPPQEPGTGAQAQTPEDDQGTDDERPGALKRFFNFLGLGKREEEELLNLARARLREERKKPRGTSTARSVDDLNLKELAIHAEMSVGDLVKFLSQTRSDDEEVINSFEEENEHPAGTAIHHTWITFFYVAPPVAAVIIGLAVGWKFGGSALSFNSLAIMLMCVLFEAIPVLLMLATAKLLTRAIMGVRSAISGSFFIGLLFVAVAAGSSIAQWVLFEGHVNMSDPIQIFGAAIRTLALPGAEVAAAIALPILRRRSLEAQLSVLKKKNDAKIAMNRQRVANQVDLLNAAITTKATLQKEADYQKKQDLANRLIDLVTAKIIRDAERSLNDQPASGSYSSGYQFRRDGTR
jgi:hypothetical protein